MEGELSSKVDVEVHVVVVPFPYGQGHINPILQFSKRLALKGLKISVLNIVGDSPSQQHNEHDLGLNGLKLELYNRPHLPYHDPPQSMPMEPLMSCLQNSISFHLAQLVAHHRASPAPVRCIVYDSITPWVLDLARELGLPGAPFFTESCAVNAIYYHLHRGWLHIIPTHQTSLFSLPALPTLQISDLPSLLSNPHQYPGFETILTGQFCNNPDWMFINTFNALEPQVIEWIQKHTPLKTVGPTVPSIITDKRLKDDHHYGISLLESSGSDDRNIREWLDSKETHSVV